MEEQNRIIFLKGKKVILRPLNKEKDLQKFLCWLNDPEIRQYLKIFMPITEQGEIEWFDSLPKRTNDMVLGIETLEGVLIGNMGLHRIDFKNRTATTGAVIGDKEYWGKGYGTDAKMILLKYAFDELNLHKICSSVYEYNERSLRYSLHCGYKIEGRRRNQIFKNGHRWDVIELGLFRSEWAPVWKKYQETGKVK